MANYTVADIQALRERTGAGMLDVKKALDEADGDQEKAVEILRVKGLKGVAKLRPDSKLVFAREWATPEARLNGALQLSKGLAKAAG